MRGGHLLATRDRAVVIKRCATSEVLNQFIMIETTVPYKMSLKPGSNMPPMHLRHDPRYCLGYCSDMGTRSSRQHCSSQSLPPACLRSWLKFNFSGMRAVELSRMASVAGGACSRSSETCPRLYRRLRRRYIGGIWEPGLLMHAIFITLVSLLGKEVMRERHQKKDPLKIWTRELSPKKCAARARLLFC